MTDKDPVILSIIDTIQEFLYAARRHVNRDEFDLSEDTDFDVAERRCSVALRRLDYLRSHTSPDLFWYEGKQIVNLGEFILDHGLSSVFRIECARDLGTMYLAGTCETVDEHGAPDETAYRLVETEAQAKAIWPYSYEMAVRARDNRDD